jgi:xanthosine utilization system XapX-like protein
LDEKRSSARSAVIRDAVIFTPLFLAAVAGWIATLVHILVKDRSEIPFLVILSLLAFLVGFQSIQALRDLFTEPKMTTGEIVRMWGRGGLQVLPGHYIYVNKNVFKIPALLYDKLERGETVSVTYYPHTSTVVTVHKTSGKPASTAH